MANKKTKKAENTEIKLSVLDVEKKYKVDYTEYTYNGQNGDRPVSWGANNDMPLLFYNCYLKSSTLKAIIDSTVNYIMGDDIQVNEDAAKWKEEVNRNGLTMRQMVEKMALSLMIYNGIAVQIVYNRMGQPVEFFPLDFKNCRINENATKVFYSKSKWTKYQAKYDEYDIYDPKHINKENPTQIFYYRASTLSNIYPTPMYNGAINDILCEIESSVYSLNTISNGFAARYLFQMPEDGNSLTDEEKRGIEEAIKNKFCGAETEYQYMIYWRSGSDEGSKMEINKIEEDSSPERYLAIRNSVRENIFISCRCTPQLCGLPNASNGFSTNEYRDSLKIYMKNVVAPIQDVILESIDKMTGIKDSVQIVPYDIKFEE